jgi:ABC-type multidrug transport system permease subunit
VGGILDVLSSPFIERALLTILVWGLLLEVFGVIVLSSQPWRFEFSYLVILLVITLASIVLIVSRLRKKYSVGLQAS